MFSAFDTRRGWRRSGISRDGKKKRGRGDTFGKGLTSTRLLSRRSAEGERCGEPEASGLTKVTREK